MQGQFRFKEVYFQHSKAGRGSPSRTKEQAEKLLSTLLSKYVWDECGYERYKTNLSNSGGKQKSYK